MSDRKVQLEQNLSATRAEIERLAAQSGRKPPQLLPVTKFHPAADIALLADLGVTDVAENREQEARAKAAELPQLHFHMIGQIQTKKANHVARWATSVHSLDSLKLAHALERGVSLAKERGERESNLPVFIQVSADGDGARGGVSPDDLDELVRAVEEAQQRARSAGAHFVAADRQHVGPGRRADKHAAVAAADEPFKSPSSEKSPMRWRFANGKRSSFT